MATSVPPRLRWSYLTLYSISRSFTTTAPQCSSSQFNRSDFGSQPFTGVYEPGQPTGGPLGGASIVGAPRITPKMLKEHLDQFVVGQERAKKVLSTAVYNHYQRIQELQRQDEEFQELMAQHARREMHGVSRHPVEGSSSSSSSPPPPSSSGRSEMVSGADNSVLTLESDEFPGQQHTVHVYPPGHQAPPPPPPLQDYTPLTIEKSNVLLLGPSGVGKTLMAKTLARVLEVPFSMSDCTPLTQAGYIGEDVEVIIQRLLAASNYDVARAEQGIVCLDEIDKIATAKVSHGKDVSGEGVQQALLKIIEGTTVQVQAKSERSAPGRQNSTMPPPGWQPHGANSPLSGGQPPPSPGGKNDLYNVRTDNILFIFTGAFVGLHKTILDRISRGSIGFGAHVRATHPDSSRGSIHNTSLKGRKGDEELFRKHLPFFTPAAPRPDGEEQEYNMLDLVEPADLQKYGLIPELVGRVPISCALSSLSEEALVRVLTEPRNALLRQYEQLFSLSGVELRFTSSALRIIAKDAAGMGTGARGLKTVLERLLGEAMFEAPGSLTKHILITEAVAQRKQAPISLGRGQQGIFHSMIAQEEEAWEAGKDDGNDGKNDGRVTDFREFREKAMAAGSY
jgi:ATP-dependent Clp protease ATP-binding subunit ClpX